MKKVFIMLLCLVMVLSSLPSIASEQETFQDDMFTYVYKTDKYGIKYLALAGGAGNFDSEVITVPQDANGYVVQEIEASALQLFDKAKEIHIPPTVQSIGDHAFAGLKKLEKVYFSENYYLTHIGDYAFMNCYNLKEIELPESLLSIGKKAFSHCLALEKLTIPSSVQQLYGDGDEVVIEYCDRLETLELKCDYENLGLFVADCMNLKKIIFSGNISSVDDTEFGYNFFECEERESYTDPRTFTAPRDMTVVGKRGTVVEEVATRVGVPFISLREADAETFEKITGLANQLKELGLFLGTDKGFELDRPMTRAEAITMLYRVLYMTSTENVLDASHPFTDVPEWADIPVACAYADKVTYGISETEFGSGAMVTSAQYITFMLRAMGYSIEDYSWDAPYPLASHLKMLPPEASIMDFTRGDAVAITAAALFAPMNEEEITLGENLASKGIYDKEAFDKVFAENPFEAYYAKSEKIASASLPGLEEPGTNTFYHNSSILFGDDLAYIVRCTMDIAEGNTIEKIAGTGWFFTVNSDGDVLQHHYAGVYDYWDYFPREALKDLIDSDMQNMAAKHLYSQYEQGQIAYHKPTHDEVLADVVKDGMHTCKIIYETDMLSLAEIWLGGTPHGGSASLWIVYKNGSAMGDGTVVTLPLPEVGVWGNRIMPEKMEFSEDGKTLAYSHHFDERLEFSMSDSIPGRLVHEKGTYNYTVNLENGEYNLEITE